MKAPGPLVELRGFTCRFPGGATALAGVDLEVRAGEILAVMGRTGAGKSTLLKCMSGVVPRLEAADVGGDCRLFGTPAAEVDAADLAGRVGVVFQDFEVQLFSTSAALEVGFGLDQLGLGRPEIRARTAAALERVGLAGFGRRDPATLSGGEKQRLAIAAVWALRPELILLDEPTTDIDPLGKGAILALLGDLRAAGAAVVVVEHEPAVAALADRLLLLDAGRVRALGPSAELARDVDLLEQCGVRTRDLDAIARAFGIGRRLADVDDAAAELQRRGVKYIPPGGRCGVEHPAPGAPCTAPPGDGRDVLLEVEDVRYAYPEGAMALDGVSLRIRSGELVALIGQNGSGKTTLAKHLNGLLAPTAGAVRLAGTDTRRLSIGRIAASVGFVFQDPDHQLFCASVAEEVAYGPRHLGLGGAEVAGRVERSLALCGLSGRDEIDPFLLGKGERQRLAVAAVLSLEPRALILDEPTTGLDHREQRAILGLLADLHRSGRTIVVITHAPWLVAEVAERAVLLERGRVLFDGDVRELFGAPELLRRASFALPEAAELGMRLGFPARSARELIAALAGDGNPS